MISYFPGTPPKTLGLLRFTSLALGLFFGVGSASAEPSLSETTSWLESKLGNYNVQYNITMSGEKPFLVSTTVKRFSIGSGTLTYAAETETGGGSGGHVILETIEAPLKELSARVEVEQRLVTGISFEPGVYRVRVATTTGNHISFRRRVVGLTKPSTKETSSFHIEFTDRKLADRVVKAFERLITLSGGKAEPF